MKSFKTAKKLDAILEFADREGLQLELFRADRLIRMRMLDGDVVVFQTAATTAKRAIAWMFERVGLERPAPLVSCASDDCTGCFATEIEEVTK